MHVEVEAPQMARFTSGNKMIKDRHYYKGQEISWNNPALLNPKIYSHFQKCNDDNKQIIEKMINQQKKDNENQYLARIERIILQKKETRERYSQRVEERSLIQEKSQQVIKPLDSISTTRNESFAEELVAKRNLSMKHKRVNENNWNMLHQLCKKRVKMQLTPTFIRGEESSVRNAEKALKEDKYQKLKKKKEEQEFHENTRNTLKSRQEKNSQVAKLLGIISSSPNNLLIEDTSKTTKNFMQISSKKSSSRNNSNITEKESDHRNCIGKLRLIDSNDVMRIASSGYKTQKLSSIVGRLSVPKRINLNGTFQYDEPQNSGETANQEIETCKSTSRIHRLALPKRVSEKTINEAYSELKGSLIGIMDKTFCTSNNDICNMVASNSKFLKSYLKVAKETQKEKNSKDQSSFVSFEKTPQIKLNSSVESLKPPKLHLNSIDKSAYSIKGHENPISNSEFSQRQAILDEINSFEFYLRKDKINGYPRISLEQAYGMFSSRPSTYKSDRKDKSNSKKDLDNK